MNNERIAQALGQLFDKQRIVFWCDTQQEFAAEFAALDLPGVEHSVARLKRLDAALCQMDLGLYGFCSDCEEPLLPEQLEQDPTLQRCPRCEARYRKGFHAHEL